MENEHFYFILCYISYSCFFAIYLVTKLQVQDVENILMVEAGDLIRAFTFKVMMYNIII